MSKLSKIIISLLLVFAIIFSFSNVLFAAVDMNLGNNNSTNTSNSSSTTLSSTVSTSEFDLELTNILSIVLIVVGVLLKPRIF